MLIFLSCCSCWCDHRILPPSSLFKSTFSMASKPIFPSYPPNCAIFPPGFLRVSSGFGTAVHGASALQLGRSNCRQFSNQTNPSVASKCQKNCQKFCQTFLCNLSQAAIFLLDLQKIPRPLPLLPCKRLALEYRELFHRCFRSSTVFEDHVTVGACPLQRLTPQKTND